MHGGNSLRSLFDLCALQDEKIPCSLALYTCSNAYILYNIQVYASNEANVHQQRSNTNSSGEHQATSSTRQHHGQDVSTNEMAEPVDMSINNSVAVVEIVGDERHHHAVQHHCPNSGDYCPCNKPHLTMVNFCL